MDAPALQSSELLRQELCFKLGFDRETTWGDIEATLGKVGDVNARLPRHDELTPGQRWVWRVAGIGAGTTEPEILRHLLTLVARVNAVRNRSRLPCPIWIEPMP